MLLAYFTVTFKDIKIHPDTSKSRARKLKAKKNTVSTYLIGQIGKNKSIPDNPIDLEKILADVYVVIKQAQALIGGRVIILECENNERLIRLYESQGFQTLAVAQDPEDENPLVTMFISIK
ncbi:hypothetical protein [Marinomonas posidonica]|uniref:hypothetical protein n=1 Tax=Marinomonas posidonica TaxID=936476 RepID=UPI003736EEEA